MIPEILVFSKRIWEELAEEDRELILSLAKEAQQRQRELWYAEEEKALADMQANGVEVIEIADKQVFRDAVRPVWDKHGAEFAELIERIQNVQ
jgi:TRAP-type C4-dicarboxylate transport system substrate-binding protein